jgi:catechol 2,3-dioxygenase-like lactoylglutathione lyase family enzyme
MAVEGLDHFTINVADLERTIRFYDDVLGLKSGARPPLGFPGAWLYCGDRAVVHLVAGQPPAGEHNGAFDHIALKASDFEATRRQLDAKGIAYNSRGVPGGTRKQIFFSDPDGIKIELNFPN